MSPLNKISKVPFHILNVEVEKIYSKEIDINDNEAVNIQAEYAHDFVVACGWSWDQFLWEWSGLSKMN